MAEPRARPGQLLHNHLRSVGDRAARFGASWGGGDWAKIAGLWHDLGKYSAVFQAYLDEGDRSKRGTVNHSSAGAIHAMRRFLAEGRDLDDWEAIAGPILGHHGTLPDWTKFETRMGALNQNGQPITAEALAEAEALYMAALAGKPPDDILNYPLPLTDPTDWSPLFTRMIFSIVVDSDRSDAAFLEGDEQPAVTIAELRERFDTFIAQQNWDQTRINELRSQTLTECLNRADRDRGAYKLEAPTGFAKTFGSLGFALHHAEHNGLERIIYVAPFLTAIDQTAKAFRAVLGDHDRTIVLEHHSTADRDLLDDDGTLGDAEIDVIRERFRLRENWNARIIVTSNVQFFESLHAHDAGRCRKLHRIANAVVLLDEPQSVPVSFMAPIAKTLDYLVSDYKSTVVFVTATQPAFNKDGQFVHGVDHIEPLLPQALLDEMRVVANDRVNVTLPSWQQPETWMERAIKIAHALESCLCIVNTRKNARELYGLVRDLGTPSLYHLSAAMCGAHRDIVLSKIMSHLVNDELVKVISTQVVEAGIDIDFPRVMRAMASLDSLIQSAGRCNRHGIRLVPGEFEVFEPEDGLPAIFRYAAGLTRTLLTSGYDPFAADTIALYYELLRTGTSTDRKTILDDLDKRDFATAGRNFRLIEDTASVVIPYRKKGRLVVADVFAAAGGEQIPNLFHRIQPFQVSAQHSAVKKLRDAGRVVEVPNLRLWVADSIAYHPQVGLLGADDPLPPPDDDDLAQFII